MAHTISFSQLHNYDLHATGITIPVVLSVGQVKHLVAAKLDTGASFCIFERELGEALELDVEGGFPKTVSTPTGTFQVYGHNVTLSAFGFDIDALVYFAAKQGWPRNVLGRRGWLDRLRLGIIDYEGKLYVSAYDEP